MSNVRIVFAVAVVSLANILSMAEAVKAQEPAQSAIDRAHAFLGKESEGNFILWYVHLGANYNRHEIQSVRKITDENERVIPGKFALVYRYVWDASGTGNTDVAFICDAKGNVQDVRVLSTDAVLQQPFLVADATIQILGNALIEAFRDDMKESDIRRIQGLVDSANSEGLLELSLVIRQAVRR